MSTYTHFPPADSEISPLAWYESLCHQPGFVEDPLQKAAMERLEVLYQDIVSFQKKHRNLLNKWFSRLKRPRGVYLYGGVGRGKSFLMDTFFTCIPFKEKRRVHFHAFMQEVHHQLGRLKGESEPLSIVADHIAHTTHLLCFDEFHVSDIADAMILGRLLSALFTKGIVLVITSNYAPDQLYPDGLQRINFLPTIDLLNVHLDRVALEGSMDYRLRALTNARTWLTPIDDKTDETLNHLFTQLSGSEDLSTHVEINGRVLQSIRHAPHIIWFDFTELCVSARSQMDYLFLAERYRTLFVSNIPKLQEKDANAARRFTWLVDILYNARVQLIASSATSPALLYLTGKNAEEFARTRSRLEEMQSKEYLELAQY